MFEELKKSIDKGIDFAFITKDKLTRAVQDFARENNLTTEEALKLLDYLIKKSEVAGEIVEVEVQRFVRKTMKKMNIPSAEDFKRLEDRVIKLETAGRSRAKHRTIPTKKTKKPLPGS